MGIYLVGYIASLILLCFALNYLSQLAHELTDSAIDRKAAFKHIMVTTLLFIVSLFNELIDLIDLGYERGRL